MPISRWPVRDADAHAPDARGGGLRGIDVRGIAGRGAAILMAVVGWAMLGGPAWGDATVMVDPATLPVTAAEFAAGRSPGGGGPTGLEAGKSPAAGQPGMAPGGVMPTSLAASPSAGPAVSLEPPGTAPGQAGSASPPAPGASGQPGEPSGSPPGVTGPPASAPATTPTGVPTGPELPALPVPSPPAQPRGGQRPDRPDCASAPRHARDDVWIFDARTGSGGETGTPGALGSGPNAPSADGGRLTGITATFRAPLIGVRTVRVDGTGGAAGSLVDGWGWLATPPGWALTAAAASVEGGPSSPAGGARWLVLVAACPAVQAGGLAADFGRPMDPSPAAVSGVVARAAPSGVRPLASAPPTGVASGGLSQLPVTGTDLATLVGLGGSVTLAGVLLLTVRRRRPVPAAVVVEDLDVRRPAIVVRRH